MPLRLLALFPLIWACAACDQAPPQPRQTLQQVVAVGSQWYGHLPIWAGIERGIFQRHGFRVEWRRIESGQERLVTLSSGKAQFTGLGEITMLGAMARGDRGFYWVGNQDIAPGLEGLVGQPGIATFADLRGRRIGLPFGSSVELTVRMLLGQHHLDPNRDVRLTNLTPAEVPAAFRAGWVDAAAVWEPGLSQLRAVPRAKVLGLDTETDVYRRYGIPSGPDVLILARTWVDADPGRASRFLAAYFEALDWVRDHPDEAAALAQGHYIRQDLQFIQDNLAHFQWHDATDQREVMSDQGIFGQADYILGILYRQMRAIPRIPDFRTWVRLDLLPEPEA